jgi:hypothetical protein
MSSKIFQPAEEPKLPTTFIADFIADMVSGKDVSEDRYVTDSRLSDDQETVIIELDDGSRYEAAVSRKA